MSEPVRRVDRNLLVADIVERTGIDEPMIESLVRTFYGRARLDPLIGPVFNDAVKDWDHHISAICDFWSSVVLMTGRYKGQPMAKHFPLPIEGEHFERWLTIFGETARELCPAPAAAYFMERARRIAESLQLGIAVGRGQPMPPMRPAT